MPKTPDEQKELRINRRLRQMRDNGQLSASVINWLNENHFPWEASSGKKETQEVFEAKVNAANPKIKILGEYKGSGTRVTVRCLQCGYTWDAWADGLKAGKGCPKCSGFRKPTQKEFKERLKKARPELELLSEYIKYKTNVHVRSLICSHDWWATPNNLIAGTGCPVCLGRSSGIKMKDFLGSVKKANPNITVHNSDDNLIIKKFKKKFSCSCKDCGFDFDAKASDLLHEKACPFCNRHRGGKLVRCVETDKIYPSIKAAAAANGFKSSSSIQAALRDGSKTVKGYHWEYFESADSVLRKKLHPKTCDKLNELYIAIQTQSYDAFEDILYEKLYDKGDYCSITLAIIDTIHEIFDKLFEKVINIEQAELTVSTLMESSRSFPGIDGYVTKVSDEYLKHGYNKSDDFIVDKYYELEKICCMYLYLVFVDCGTLAEDTLFNYVWSELVVFYEGNENLDEQNLTGEVEDEVYEIVSDYVVCREGTFAEMLDKVFKTAETEITEINLFNEKECSDRKPKGASSNKTV